MSKEVSRRNFVRGAAMGAAAGAMMVGTSKTSWAGANDKVRVAIIGLRGRGRDHLKGLLGQKNVEVAAVCDIDEKQFGSYVKQLEKLGGKPKTYKDMRELFQDKDIDAVTVATPNHWHSLAAIWALQAGKHVYVEKPCSHNVFEGSKLVEAAQKYGKVVQHGSQIRSNPSMQEAIRLLNEGVIGEVYMARGLCYRWRDDIGKKADGPVPEGVDYNMWLGPAPERPFNPNRFHYNWHYMWDYGNGDIGNQGVHQMDVARWGLGKTLPSYVHSRGGRLGYEDQGQTPNTQVCHFEYDDGVQLVFEVRGLPTNSEAGVKIGNSFYGSNGWMSEGDDWKARIGYDDQEAPDDTTRELPAVGGSGEKSHHGNWLRAVRSRKVEALTAWIEEGHYSAALCHLAMASYRLRRALEFNPVREEFVDDDEANEFLARPRKLKRGAKGQLLAPEFQVPDRV